MSEEIKKCSKCGGEWYLMEVMTSDVMPDGKFPVAVWCKEWGRRNDGRKG